MFRRKSEKRILELSNKLIEQGKPTEDVVELLLKIMK